MQGVDYQFLRSRTPSLQVSFLIPCRHSRTLRTSRMGHFRNSFPAPDPVGIKMKPYSRRTSDPRSCILFASTELSAKLNAWQAEVVKWYCRSVFSQRPGPFDSKQIAVGTRFTFVIITAMLR